MWNEREKVERVMRSGERERSAKRERRRRR